MATITSTGVGSGLDVNSLVQQLVAAERQTADKRIASTDAKLTTEFTALATLKGGMSAFQAALQTMTTSAAIETRKVTVGDEKALSATAETIAATGSYEVEIRELAKAAQLGSIAFVDGEKAVVGTGKLTLAVGGKSFSVDITSANDELAQIRDAINGAKGNTGIRATIIRDTEGAHLVLTGTATGEANAITVTPSGGNGGLDQLAFHAGLKNLVEKSPAQDAVVVVSGYEIHSATNTVSGAIDGVTLNLGAAEVGKEISLKVDRDDASIVSKVEGFVAAYNTLATQIKTLGGYNAATKVAGPLLGDAMLRGLESYVRRTISEPVAGVAGAHTTLASLGITTTESGTLALDGAKLKKALAADPQSVAKVLTGENGVATKLNSYLLTKLSSAGELATRNTGITNRRTDLVRQQEALEARMVVIQERYLKQFTALDSMLTQLQSTSNYLSQQFANLSNLNKG
jgi:flagellar hook-associated protein 2